MPHELKKIQWERGKVPVSRENQGNSFLHVVQDPRNPVP